MKPIQIALAPTRSRALNMFFGVVLALVSVLFFCALATYHIMDPSWNTATDPSVAGAGPGQIANWVGPFGAFLSDLLLQWMGITAFLLPLWIGGVAWGWMRSRPGGSAMLRTVGMAMALLFVPALFALLPWHWRWAHAVPVEGVTGRLISGMLVAYLNVQGAWIVTGVLAVAGLYFASSISFWAVKESLADQWVRLQALYERWRNWRDERADRRAEEMYEEQNRPGPSQSLYAGAIGAEKAGEPIAQKSPGRLAAWFGRKPTVPEPDPVDEPAVQRAAVARAEEPIPIARRSSIWDRMGEGEPAAPGRTSAGVPEARPDVAVPVRPMTSVAAAARTASAEAFAELRSPGGVPSQASEARPGPPGFAGSGVPSQVSNAGRLGAPGFVPEARRVEARPEAPVPEPRASVPLPMRAEPAAPQQPQGNGIQIHERADAETRHAVVAPKNVAGFKLPPSTLLNAGGGPQAIREDELREEAKVLVEKCAEFDVRGQVVQINPGPMVTTYEFKPEAVLSKAFSTGQSATASEPSSIFSVSR